MIGGKILSLLMVTVFRDKIMGFSDADILAIVLTLKLAFVVTLLLLLFGLPLAWWLARTTSPLKHPISAVVALPLVLPPTVIGFYLLIFLGPKGPVGEFMVSLGMNTLPFTFGGLVVASIIYSMPFVIQPIQNAMESIEERQIEAAKTLGAGPVDRFFNVVLPLSKKGVLTASVLGFAHTVGEFGIVLMIGGSIPGQTQVISLQIYDHVESLEYAQAHWLSGTMILFSFTILVLLYGINGFSRGNILTRNTSK